MAPHRRPPEPFVFFVDECLGRRVVADALRSALASGEEITSLPAGVSDEAWLPRAGSEGWLCFSKDRKMSTRPNELDAIRSCGVALFTLGEASGAEHARRIVLGLPTIRTAARALLPGFIARIEPDGGLVVYFEGGRRLEAPKRRKPRR